MSQFKQYAFSILSGLLFGFAWNNILPAFSLFFAFIPLLYLLSKSKISANLFFKQSFIAFFLFHLITVWWIYKSGFWGFIAVISINSFLMASVLSLSFYTRKIFGKFAGYWALISYWIAFEYLHYYWDLQWPFMNLGNWLGQIPSIIQWYEYTGVLGGSLWILLVNIFLFEFYLSLRQKFLKNTIINGLILISLLVFPLSLSHFLMKKNVHTNEKVNVLIVQPNINPYTEKYDKSLFNRQVKEQIDMAAENLDSTIDLLIFPETSLPLYLNRDSLSQNNVLKKLQALTNKYEKLSVIAGLYTYKLINIDTLYYNTAIFINKNQDFILHDKSKLVPGVERTPFVRFLNILSNINVDFGGINSSLQISKKQKIFVNNKLQIAPLICYESVFGNYTAEFVKNRANIIVVITNDAWWGNTPSYRQILMHSQLRAIENRKQIIRAANTGITALINEYAQLIDNLPVGEKSILKISAQTNNKQTFYTQNGDFIGRVAAFTAIILIIAAFVRKKNGI